MALRFGVSTTSVVPRATAASPAIRGVAMSAAMTPAKMANSAALNKAQTMKNRRRSTRSDQAPAGRATSNAGRPKAIPIRPSAPDQSVRVTISQTKANRTVPLTPNIRTWAIQKLRKLGSLSSWRIGPAPPECCSEPVMGPLPTRVARPTLWPRRRRRAQFRAIFRPSSGHHRQPNAPNRGGQCADAWRPSTTFVVPMLLISSGDSGFQPLSETVNTELTFGPSSLGMEPAVAICPRNG